MSTFTLFLLVISFSSSSVYVSACDRCVHQTKASRFTSNTPLSAGACGYSSLALGLNGGYLAAASPSLFRDGVACGACFHVRCKNNNCSRAGTKVILTDLNNNNATDFVLSNKAFMGLAQKGMAQNIIKLGVVDIEYKRIPCDYKKQNLAVRVEEWSQRPHQLAIKFLYQGGQTDIVGADVAQVGSPYWSYLSRTSSGTVWNTSRVPQGALQFRLVVTGGFDGKMVWAPKVLPADWKNGVIYDTGVQIDDIAQEGCLPCDDQEWK